MGRLRRSLLSGAAAGAAGTTVLNAVTYLDMAVRGRPSSSTPQDSVERIAEATGVDIPGEGDERDNRVAGLAPLLGIATGVGAGAVTGAVVGGLRLAMPTPALAGVLALGAMAGSNVPMRLLGVSDPTSWSAAEWAADVVPHLAYGAATAAVLRSLVGR